MSNVDILSLGEIGESTVLINFAPKSISPKEFKENINLIGTELDKELMHKLDAACIQANNYKGGYMKC